MLRRPHGVTHHDRATAGGDLRGALADGARDRTGRPRRLLPLRPLQIDRGIATGRAAVGPTDSWATLAALARETTRLRLGTMLSAATFRLPGPLAITVAQVDQMSGGRIEFGLGAGWYEEEHIAYGIPFPPDARRAPRAPCRAARDHHRAVDDAGRRDLLLRGPVLPPLREPGSPQAGPAAPPTDHRWGAGTKLMPRLAARFADECNVSFEPVATLAAVGSALDEACLELGREPSSVVRSVALGTICGESEADCERRAAASGRDLVRLARGGAVGAPEEVAELLHAYSGCRRLACLPAAPRRHRSRARRAHRRTARPPRRGPLSARPRALRAVVAHSPGAPATSQR